MAHLLRSFIAVLFLLNTAVFAAVRGDRPTQVSVVGLLRQNATCARQLTDTVERSLDAMRAKGGTARLVFLRQMRLALEEAKVPKSKAAEVARALVEVEESIGVSIPEFAATVSFVRDNAAVDMLGFCALPKDCSLGKKSESHLAFTTRGGPAVLLAPVPGLEGGLRWALNYYSTLALAAGENYVARWLLAAYQLETLRPGSGGAYYAAYSRDYDGSFPPRAGSLDYGFARVVMNMFMTRVKTRSYSHFFPADAANAEAARVGDYATLLATRDTEVLQCLNALAVSEVNYLQKVDEVLDALAVTLRGAAERN